MFGGVPSVGPAHVGPDAILLDLREEDEWVAGHVEGARHIPMGELPARFSEVSELADDAPTGEVVVVCRSGGRSSRVVARAEEEEVVPRAPVRLILSSRRPDATSRPAATTRRS